MSPVEEDGGLHYTYGELYDRVDTKLDTVISLLATKADVSELHKLKERVETLETHRLEVLAVRTHRSKWWGISGAAIGSAGSIAIILEVFGHIH